MERSTGSTSTHTGSPAPAARLASLDVRTLRDRGHRRAEINQRQVAAALTAYYGTGTGSHGTYSARYAADRAATTSILTAPAWLDLGCPLIPPHDQLRVTTTAPDLGLNLDGELADRAVQRLAETLTLGGRMINMPLYRLLDIVPTHGEITGSVSISHFVEYALTTDLLEGELIDALTADTTAQPGTLPLRDKYLPNLESVLNLPARLCAGGTLSLGAIARPASPQRGPADYLLLIQERSGHVINAAHRLAVIPKGFHQPLTDFRTDAQLGATLRREMEEELFGRDEIDNTIGNQLHADPMHSSRLSEPMRWLLESPDRLKMESTGFGLNLVSGNYEFPALIVIDDDEFWSRYGGQIAANWESTSLRQYSSLDSQLLTELIDDVAWSNEGLFALLQGLRRLAQIGGERVNLPQIEWEIGQ